MRAVPCVCVCVVRLISPTRPPPPTLLDRTHHCVHVLVCVCAGCLTPAPSCPCALCSYLAEKYGFDPTQVGPKKLWGFGPDGKGPNWLLDATRAVDYLNEIQESVNAGFQWACRQGPLCDEQVCVCEVHITT